MKYFLYPNRAWMFRRVYTIYEDNMLWRRILKAISIDAVSGNFWTLRFCVQLAMVCWMVDHIGSLVVNAGMTSKNEIIQYNWRSYGFSFDGN